MGKHCAQFEKSGYLSVGKYKTVYLKAKSESMAQFQRLHKVTRAIIHHKQRASDLINGYIKQHERKLKLRPANFIYCIVLRFYQGKEQFISNRKDILYQNDKKSVMASNLKLLYSLKLPLKYIWSVKNPINVEWRLFGISKDCHTICRTGCYIIGNKRGELRFSRKLMFPYFYVHGPIGDKIQLKLEIRLDEVTVRLDREPNNDNLISWRNFKESDSMKQEIEVDSVDPFDRPIFKFQQLPTLDKIELGTDLFVIPKIEMLRIKGFTDGKSAEMHLIFHFVTFD